MFAPPPPRLVRLRQAIATARQELAEAEARWGSLSIEYVVARERRDGLTRALRDAQLARLTTYVRLVWGRARGHGARGPRGPHSHSMVAGGLDEMS